MKRLTALKKHNLLARALKQVRRSDSLTRLEREMIHSVWQWATDTEATDEDIVRELADTIARDGHANVGNTRGRDFLRVITDYDGRAQIWREDT